MSLLTIAAASTIALYPVEQSNPVLSEEGTFISPAASEVLASSDSASIFCLDLPEGAASHDTICLTSEEWEVVLDQAAEREAHEESAAVRDRQINQGHWRSSTNNTEPTP